MDGEWLAGRFEAERARLQAVAYRMLGSTSEADDAVQEVWLRLNRADTTEVENLGGWLTTVVAPRVFGHAALAHVASRGATDHGGRPPAGRRRPRARSAACGVRRLGATG